jgi:opacity protein-like surface antigen
MPTGRGFQMTQRSVFVRSLRVACLLLATFLFAPSEARAQGFVSPLIGYNFGGSSGCPAIDECEDKNLNAGVAIGTMGAFLGFEVEAAYAKDFFGEAPGINSNVLTVMGNIMFVPNLHPFRPYLLTGLGLVRTNVDLTPSGVLDSSNSNLGWNIGGGLMIFFGDHVGIRGDIRYFHTFQDLEFLGFELDGEKLDFGRAAAALVFKF